MVSKRKSAATIGLMLTLILLTGCGTSFVIHDYCLKYDPVRDTTSPTTTKNNATWICDCDPDNPLHGDLCK